MFLWINPFLIIETSSSKINLWRDEVVWLLSKLEALIDFSDEELPSELEQIFNLKVSKMLEDMKKDAAKERKALREELQNILKTD